MSGTNQQLNDSVATRKYDRVTNGHDARQKLETPSNAYKPVVIDERTQK